MCVQQGAAEDHNKPVLDGGSGVFAAAHADHDDGEEEEEAGHGEAHAVHRLVAHDHLAVHLVLHAWNAAPAHAEARDLDARMGRRGEKVQKLLLGYSPTWSDLRPPGSPSSGGPPSPAGS